jgi:hypothetical protein
VATLPQGPAALVAVGTAAGEEVATLAVGPHAASARAARQRSILRTWHLPRTTIRLSYQRAPASPDFQLYPWPIGEGYNTCVSASNFTDGNGTRLVMETCDRYDTSQIWNLG